MSDDDGEPSDERGDEGGACGFVSDPPLPSTRSVGMVWLYLVVCVLRAWPMANRRRDRSSFESKRMGRLQALDYVAGLTESTFHARRKVKTDPDTRRSNNMPQFDKKKMKDK
jgi:hypothetical protein